MLKTNNVSLPRLATVAELRDVLRALAATYPSRREMAEALNVSQSYLALLLRERPPPSHRRRPDYQTLDDRLLEALGYEPRTYYRRAS